MVNCQVNKQEVAIEALKGTKTIQQIASDYKISPDVVKEWKKQAREMMEEGFKRKGKKKTKEAELEAKIGGDFSFFPDAPAAVKQTYKASDWPGLGDVINDPLNESFDLSQILGY